MEEDVKSLKEYLQIIRRRKYLIVGSMLLLLISSVIIAFALPPVYRSEATILIEQQHIPSELVKSTVISFADERIKQIQQKLMTIDNINKIIDKYDLYPGEKNRLSASDLAELFRTNTTLELINADIMTNGKANKSTLAFKLSFDHKVPSLTQKVANELTTLFLDENIKSRTERAEETSNFLNEEAEKLKKEVEIIETQIAEYKKKYGGSLPELLPTNLASINRIENEIQQSELQEKLLAERKINLQTQLSITSPIPIDLTGKTNAVPDSLPVLQAEYDQLLTKYSSSHPDVKAIKRKIDHFKPPEHADQTEKNQAGITNPAYLQLKNELDMAIIEQEALAKHRDKLRLQLKLLEDRVSQTHQVERGYYELMRDLDNNKVKYQELKAKYLEAKLSQNLEIEQKAEKFSILESARVPDKPEKPNRMKILIMGFGASIGFGIGIGFAIEMLDGSIRGYKSLTRLTGMEPLVIIPYIENQDDLNRHRKNKISFSILGVILLIASIIAVHFLYMPLNLLMDKLLYRISTL
jgi:polysaccharide chain length determinant protein (PEP-CTERM system associated)